MSGENNHKVASNVMWAFLEKTSAQLVSMGISIILARMLVPEDYGIISIVSVIITFMNVFVESGFGSALVQKKEADDDDFSTGFTISLIVSVVLYITLYFCSPIIEKFYETQNLALILRVMGIRLPIAAINQIQAAYIRRKLAFKKFFYSTLLSTIISGIGGVVLAFLGFGVWALVFQNIASSIFNVIILRITSRFTLKINLVKNKIKPIWSFGWKVLLSNLISNMAADTRSLIIGKVFSISDLAFFDQGKKYPAQLVTSINASFERVMLPVYSKMQDNREELKQTLRNNIRITMLLLSPVLVGFAAVAKDFVTIFLTEKWLGCVPFIYVTCLMYLTRPYEALCHQLVLAVGRSDIELICMIAIDGSGFILAIIAAIVFKSVFLVAFSMVISTWISVIMWSYYSNKLAGYRVKEQIADILPALADSMIMGIVVLLIGKIEVMVIFRFILQIVTGIFVYILLVFVTNRKEINTICSWRKR